MSPRGATESAERTRALALVLMLSGCKLGALLGPVRDVTWPICEVWVGGVADSAGVLVVTWTKETGRGAICWQHSRPGEVQGNPEGFPDTFLPED